MNLEDIREKLEAKDYSFYFFDPVVFNEDTMPSLLARLFIELRDPDTAKKLIFYWLWISHDCQKKFKAEVIQLLEATGRMVNHCGGKWFSNLWELQAFVKGLYEREEA
jgi:hypothetical protein